VPFEPCDKRPAKVSSIALVRQTFITTAAKNVYRAGGSLRDVQLLAGHQSIDTTQRYIDDNFLSVVAPRKISPYGVMTGVRVRSEVDRSILGLSSRPESAWV
jgi:hypothetical protein